MKDLLERIEEIKSTFDDLCGNPIWGSLGCILLRNHVETEKINTAIRNSLSALGWLVTAEQEQFKKLVTTKSRHEIDTSFLTIWPQNKTPLILLERLPHNVEAFLDKLSHEIGTNLMIFYGMDSCDHGNAWFCFCNANGATLHRYGTCRDETEFTPYDTHYRDPKIDEIEAETRKLPFSKEIEQKIEYCASLARSWWTPGGDFYHYVADFLSLDMDVTKAHFPILKESERYKILESDIHLHPSDRFNPAHYLSWLDILHHSHYENVEIIPSIVYSFLCEGDLCFSRPELDQLKVSQPIFWKEGKTVY